VSEKLKPNFTPVPNVIFDKIMRTLTPGAVKVIFAICRYTYGWGKKSDRISLSQLSDMTGMERKSVVRTVRQLGNLVIIRRGNPRTNQASEYRINVEIADSDLVSLGHQPSVTMVPIQRNKNRTKKKTLTLPTARVRANPSTTVVRTGRQQGSE